MIKKLVVSFTLATVVFAGPAAASLDSSTYFKNWFERQLNAYTSDVNQEVLSHSITAGINWLNWLQEMDATIVTKLDIAHLITSTSNQMDAYAEEKANRLEEAKRSLHMNELEAFEAERKQNLPDEMASELEEFFKTQFLNGE